MIGFDYSFAAEAGASGMQNLATFFHFILSFLSWGWIIFAKIGGELLSNSRVYGEVLGLDSYLWMLRNMMRNIANYILWFLFIYYIGKELIGKGQGVGFAKDIIIKILVAGVGIQASRFLTAAIIDLSNIATAAVGSFPAQITANNSTIYKNITEWALLGDLEKVKSAQNAHETLFTEKKMRTYKGDDGFVIEKVKLTEEVSEKGIIDAILPNENSLDGVLIFIGINILEITEIEPLNLTDTVGGLVGAFIQLIINGASIIIYGVAMVLLCIIALIRIVYLRIFIIISPLLILLFCLENVGNKEKSDLWGISKTLGEKGINLWGFISLAFKPVIITLALSVTLILMTLMQDVIKKSNQGSLELNNVTITSTEVSSTSATPKYDTKIETPISSVSIKGLGKSFLDMILSIITLVMIRMVIKLGITSGNKIWAIKNFSKWSTDFIQTGFKELPLIPVGGKGGVSMGSVWRTYNDIKAAWRDNFNEEITRQEKNILKMFVDDKSPDPEIYTKLSQASRKPTNEFRTVSKEIINNGQKIWFNDPNWKPHFYARMNGEGSKNDETINTTDFFREWDKVSKTIENNDERIEKVLANDDARKSFWNNFLGRTTTVPSAKELLEESF